MHHIIQSNQNEELCQAGDEFGARLRVIHYCSCDERYCRLVNRNARFVLITMLML